MVSTSFLPGRIAFLPDRLVPYSLNKLLHIRCICILSFTFASANSLIAKPFFTNLRSYTINIKTSLVLALFFAVAFAASIVPNEEDDDCSVVWITVDGNVPETFAAVFAATSMEAPIVTSPSVSSSSGSVVSTSAAGN